MREYLKAERLLVLRDSLLRTMATGVVARGQCHDDEVPAGELGKMYTIGHPDVAQVQMRFIEARARGRFSREWIKPIVRYGQSA